MKDLGNERASYGLGGRGCPSNHFKRHSVFTLKPITLRYSKPFLIIAPINGLILNYLSGDRLQLIF